MKKIFQPIGKFFGAIWRWIKETAWVQPLLIVSIIFGLIFSIKPISEGISSLAENVSNSERLYKDNKVTLTNGKAYNLVEDVDGARFKDDDKYFLVFVESSCANCKAAYKGFKELLNNKTYNHKEEGYKLKTIYIDEDGGVDKNDKNNEFTKLFFNNDSFREAITTVAKNSSYESNVGYDENKLAAIESGEDFYTPLILLMDKATQEADEASYGIKEVLVGVSGTTPIEKADFLEDAWKSDGDFKL